MRTSIVYQSYFHEYLADTNMAVIDALEESEQATMIKANRERVGMAASSTNAANKGLLRFCFGLPSARLPAKTAKRQQVFAVGGLTVL
jgi:hypothetical protein